ncbi:hypothetical protein E1A91_A12G242300v1 [Gossypium mustelinum]|uniref:Major facilitator superfamily (MFS) profile domain-containing protein n=1 Tax=Gossypium mustelinum TaxID=34275 RepID=A0A5D2WYF4_GOSMU|nr:hypothetical protein E1A91_A12G242300v1 [Gossypium mustelinum]
MAGGEGVTSGSVKNYPGKFTLKVFVTCIVAASGGLIFGYDLGISGGVTSMDSFLEKFFPKVYRKEISVKPSDDQYCKFDSQTLTLFTSSLYLAALLSSMTASRITRGLGRRMTMMFGGLFFAIGAVINGFAENVLMLIISVPIYLSEIAPFKYRGAMNIMFQLSITIGILIVNLLNYFTAKIEGGWGWRLSLGGAVVPGLVFFFGCFFLADSPNSLLERDKFEEAKVQLQKIRGIDNVEEEFNDLAKASEAAKLVQNPWREILTRKYRPQLIFAVLIPLFQQLTGMNVFVFYASVLFKSMGFGNNASLMSALITSIVNFFATLVSIATVDKFGRRTLFLEGGLQMLLCQFVMTVSIASKFGTSGNPGELPLWFSMLVVIAMCVYIAGFAWSWGPLGWLVPSEIFPLEIRSAAQSITVAVNMIFTFCIAQFGLFIFFAVCVIGMSIFIFKLLPETKGVPIEEMTIVWKNHPRWTSRITRGLGRRMTMMFGGLFFAIGAVINGFAENVLMLIIGRVLLGFGIGFANQSVPIYLSEIAPFKYRGALNIMFQLSITIGILVANLLNYFTAKIEGGWGWRLSLGGAVVPGLEEFNDLAKASEAAKLVQNPWKEILTRKYRPQLIFAILIPLFQQLTGMNVFVFYAPVLFKSMGFGNNASLMSALITSIVNFSATLVSIATVDKYGRRTLFLEGGLQMLLCQLVMTVSIASKFGTGGNPGELPLWFSMLVVIAMCVYIAGFAWSWGPLGWLVPSEIFPLEIRSAAQSITVAVNMIFTFCIAQVFTTMLCNLKFGLFIYKFLPETKGVPIEEMTIVWKNHPRWSKYFVEKDSSFEMGKI